ncbi:MAG: GTPase Era [Desulfuromonadales bacterium]|nr:GTPase Era [Desulfuromonadales bacterium]
MNHQQKSFRSGFIAIIGRPNVGKSTLLNHLVGQKIAITSPKPQTTRNRILGILTRDDAQLLFLDTPGIHEAKSSLNRYMVEQARTACQDVDAVLWLVEADREVDEHSLVHKILSQVRTPVILGINKVDLVAREKLLPMIDVYRKQRDYAAIVPISALNGTGTDTLLEVLLDQLPEGPQYFPEEQVTDLPERFIVAEIIREQILNRTREEVPYGVAVVVEQFREDSAKNLVLIDAVINVERDSHKRIIVGKGGSMIRSIGKAARLEIERLLGVKLYLELFVKVQKNWTGSDRLMKEFGYR